LDAKLTGRTPSVPELQNLTWRKRVDNLARLIYRSEPLPGQVRRDRHQGKREMARRLKALEKAAGGRA
jgi:hypothetical protein